MTQLLFLFFFFGTIFTQEAQRGTILCQVGHISALVEKFAEYPGLSQYIDFSLSDVSLDHQDHQAYFRAFQNEGWTAISAKYGLVSGQHTPYPFFEVYLPEEITSQTIHDLTQSVDPAISILWNQKDALSWHQTNLHTNQTRTPRTDVHGFDPASNRLANLTISQRLALYNSAQFKQQYVTYPELEIFLDDMETEYPACQKIQVGEPLESGRALVGMRISKNVDRREIEPEFKYVGNIHGDETVGREILIYLIHLICTESEHLNSRPLSKKIHKLIDTTDIYILPTMNPDGFDLNQRRNRNGLDLNRNFPDIRFPGRNQGQIQPETQKIMDWLNEHTFSLSINFHGGAIVANYPFDGGLVNGKSQITPDNGFFYKSALTYSKSHEYMWRSKEFTNGVTNGAEWYVLFGGMQDFNYLQHGCNELTVELSDIKTVDSRTLQYQWEANKFSLIRYMELVHYGLRGIVLDSENQPIPKAKIQVGNFQPVFSHPLTGDWYKLAVTPDIFEVSISAENFQEKRFLIDLTSEVNLYQTPIVTTHLERL